MESAKESVKKFMSKSGKHDTTVHENVSPAVTQEQVHRTEHENVTSALDKEVHQDHYHTSVQPVQHSETLPEQHHTKAVPVEHRQFDHDAGDAKRRHDEEQAKFVNTQSHHEGERTRTDAPTVAGEHRHHHVHETIQPVIQKQTIEPHVTHTTVPVHEVHHNAAQHHSSSALPAVSMADFKKQGGALGGREERSDQFSGEPRHIGGEQGPMGIGHGSDQSRSGEGYTSQLDPARSSHTGTTGTTGSTSHMGSTSNMGSTGMGSTGTTGTSRPTGTDGPIGTSGTSGTTSSSGNFGHQDTTAKPSMMDKLNPKVDATGDGQAGFMK